MDYMKHEHKVSYAFTMELDPTFEQVNSSMFTSVSPFSNTKSEVIPVALMAITALLVLRHTHILTHVYTRTHLYTHTLTQIHSHTHTLAHIHSHTHTLTPVNINTLTQSHI